MRARIGGKRFMLSSHRPHVGGEIWGIPVVYDENIPAGHFVMVSSGGHAVTTQGREHYARKRWRTPDLEE